MLTIPQTLRAWLIVGLIAAAIIFAFVFSWNYSHVRISQLERSVEAEQLAKNGEIAAHLETKAQLAAVAAKQMASDHDLAIATAKLKAIQPDAELVSAATLSTGAVAVEADPEESDGAGLARCGASVLPSPGPGLSHPFGPAFRPHRVTTNHPDEAPAQPADDVAQTAAPAQPPSSENPCVLRNGDQASITVNDLTFKTAAGNYIPIGTATAWREGPGPRTKLFSHAFEAAFSYANGLAVPSPPRWGFGGQGACFALGCAAGPGVAFPPARFTIFGHAIEIDANANLLVGNIGAGLGAGAYVRF